MKKIITVISAAVLFALLLTGCGKTEATKQTQELIGAIGTVTVDSEAAISSARSAYDALSAEEKEKVKNYEELEKAEADYKDITDFNSDISEIVEAAATSFSEEDFNVSELLKKAAEIKTVYENMSEERKAQVKDYDKLGEAANKLNSYVENAKTAAAEYVKAFNAVYAEEKYTVTGVYCIKQIRNGTDEYHLFALKYKTADGEEKTAYSHARCTTEVAASAIEARPETFFADEPVTDDSDAVVCGNVTLELEAVMKLVNS